jgi:hypothetical protein
MTTMIEMDTPLSLAETGTRGRESNRRLFMQFMAFGECADAEPVIEAVEAAGFPAVVYADLHDPFGIGLLTMTEDPEFLAGPWRELLRSSPLAELRFKPQYTMLGRTYTLGYEPDLEETLVHRPTRTALQPEWPWVVWYPLRRSGAFAQLPADEQKQHLKEHGQIGFMYGRGDYAHDIRLACHGLDTHDNDFVVAVTGKELAPLSKLVEHMRQTQQTSLYLERLGPFFVGRALWKSPIPAASRPPDAAGRNPS